MYATISDHISWLFRPRRFFSGKQLPSHYRVRGWETLLFVDQPEEVEAVNAATGTVFLGGAGNEFLSALLGEQSVFLLDHSRHRMARRIMAPALSAKAVQKYTPFIDEIVLEEIERVQFKAGFSAGAWSRRVAMRVVCRVALGVDDPVCVSRLLSRFEATTGYLANIVSYMRRFWTPHGLFSVGTLTAMLVRRIDDELYPIIQEAKKSRSETSGSVLDLLIAAQQEHGYDDAFIRDNLVALLAAGYDTTGSALSWMMYWLARDQTASTELNKAFRTKDRAALQAFRDEVLRYCPPVEILPRRISTEHREEALDLLEGLDAVPDAGENGPMVCPFVHRVHHNESIWENPEKFDPSRFRQGKRYGKNEFLPFGAGPRLCIGLNLGRLILDQTLSGILSENLTVSTRQLGFNPVRRNVSIWPGFNLKINLRKKSRR